MRKASILLAAMAIVVAVFAGTALAATLVGNAGPNTLVGTGENDTIRGLGGNDRLSGKGDSDRLFGGAGNDVIDAVDPGGLEGDTVNCGPGFDRVLADRDTEDVIAANCERIIVR